MVCTGWCACGGRVEVGGGQLRRARRLWGEAAPCSESPGLLSSLCASEGFHNSRCFCSQQRAPGKVLLDAVCNHLNLVEGDYFGLEFPDHKKITVGDVESMSYFTVSLTREKGVIGTFPCPPRNTQRKITQKALLIFLQE